MHHNRELKKGGVLRSLFWLFVVGSLAIAAYFLFTEHRAHILGGKWMAPALLIAFVGLHLLMHLGHGGHGGHSDGGSDER